MTSSQTHEDCHHGLFYFKRQTILSSIKVPYFCLFLIRVDFILIESVSTLCMNTCMAPVTEADEVCKVVCPSFSQRLDVVHFRSRNQLSVFLADLAERIRYDERFPDPSPFLVVVSLVDLRIPAVPVVSLVHYVRMFRTVRTFGQLAASWILARLLRFVGQYLPP